MLGVIAHYNLLERLGDSGLGEVYRARDTRVGRTVALKLTPAGFAEGYRHDRLLEDARKAAGLSHPNIATLFDIGEHEGRLYFAYEFVQGTTIRQLMNGTSMNIRRALDLAVQVADALAEAHSRNVIHKDLRPDTILETGKGSAKVLDFGMAVWTPGGKTRALAAAAPGSVGSDASIVVAYMSPEQALGSHVDARTDIFSLAVIVYEMLTGIHPFAAADPAETLINVTRMSPSAPSTINPELPKMVDLVLARALTKALEGRTASASKFAADLRRCRGLVEPREGEARASTPASSSTATDLLPIEEERGGAALWWLLAALGGGVAAAGYFLMR